MVRDNLDLGQLRDLGFGLFQLAEQIGVLDGHLLLGGIQVVEGAVGLISLVLSLVELVLELFGDLLLTGLFVGHVVETSAEVIDFAKVLRALFLSLGLKLVELVKLLAHLSNGVVVLLAQVGKSRLVLDVGLLEVTAEFAELSLALLWLSSI